jgi:chorismate-pyruvate lyase
VSLLYPLDEFYQQSGAPLPAATKIDGWEVPEDQRRLLVHDNDMTPTLEAAYGQSIHLRVLRHKLNDEVFSRQVVLLLEDDITAVVFGAIRICLARLSDPAKQLVLKEKMPFGGILHEQRIPHASRPESYFRVEADAVIGEALRLPGPCTLYGRRNVLRDGCGHTLAEVLEILPPWRGDRKGEKTVA